MKERLANGLGAGLWGAGIPMATSGLTWPCSAGMVRGRLGTCLSHSPAALPLPPRVLEGPPTGREGGRGDTGVVSEDRSRQPQSLT